MSRRFGTAQPIARSSRSHETIDFLRSPRVGQRRDKRTSGAGMKIAIAVSIYLNLALALVLYLK